MSESVGILEKAQKGCASGTRATMFPLLFLSFHRILPEVPKQGQALANQPELSSSPPHKERITTDANLSTANHHPHCSLPHS